MRLLRLLLVCLGLFGISGPVWATRISIGDPPPAGVITPVTSSPFLVTFSGDCSVLLPNSRIPEMGCFGFLNRSGSDWSEVDLTLTAAPDAFSFTCNDQPPVTPVFASTDCGYNRAAGQFELRFSNGLLPSNTNEYFVITEDDLPPEDLTFTATFTTAATPEPSAGLLMGSGGLLLSALVWSRRRAFA